MNKMMVVWGIGALSALLGGSGCTMDAASGDGAEGQNESETMGDAASPLTGVDCDHNTYDACYEQTDSTGSISIRLYACKFSSVLNKPSAFCPVEADRALVGGGAEVEGSPSPGAMLVATFPSSQTWVAISKDHIYPNPHRVRAYAIGLRLANYSVAQLKSVITLTQATSPYAAGPAGAVALLPQGHVLLGGGALAGWNNGPGQLLTTSTPTAAGWVAKSKDHIQSSVGGVSAITISMPSCPANLERQTV
jgi:hypothetical protein